MPFGAILGIRNTKRGGGEISLKNCIEKLYKLIIKIRAVQES